MKNNELMILSYEQWSLNENKISNYSKKINFLLPGKKIVSLTGKNNIKKYGGLNSRCLNGIFNVFYANRDANNKDLDIDTSLPMIYYGGNLDNSLKFLKKFNIKEDVMYNTPPSMKLSGNKSNFYKKFADAEWLPKAVYSIEDAKDLEFPVIAKPDGEHSGRGIEIFNNYEDLKNSKKTFNNFSEAKDIKQEFRILLVNDKICLVNERISKKDNEIKDKDTDESTEFIYVDQDLDKLDFLDKVAKICDDIRDKDIKLGLWSIDLMIDKSNKCWVPEINSASGMASDKMAIVYSMIYEDFYKEKLPEEFSEYLYNTYIKPIYEINMKVDGKFIRKSPCRVKDLK